MLDFFLQNKIKGAFKKQLEMHRVFLNFNVIKRVLILFDYDNWSEVKPIVDDLVNNGKSVILWTISTTAASEELLNSYEIRVVNPQKDLHWTRTLRATVINEYDSLGYDTFLDLSFSNELLMLYLKAKNRAEFSIGVQESSARLYNFILLKEENKSLFETYEQIKFYLTANA